MQRDFSSSLTSTEEVKEKVSEAVQGMKPRGRQVRAPSSCVALHVLLPPSPCVSALPLPMQEDVVSQLHIQVKDLERYITYLQGEKKRRRRRRRSSGEGRDRKGDQFLEGMLQQSTCIP